MRFKLSDFPIGSIAYFYKIINLQNNPSKRKPGDKRHRKGYVFSKVKITHHIKMKDGGLVGTEYDNKDEGFDVNNSRFEKEGFLLLPKFVVDSILRRVRYPLTPEEKLVLLLRDPMFDSDKINEIVKTTKIELKPHWKAQLTYADQKKQFVA